MSDDSLDYAFAQFAKYLDDYLLSWARPHHGPDAVPETMQIGWVTRVAMRPGRCCRVKVAVEFQTCTASEALEGATDEERIAEEGRVKQALEAAVK